MRTKTVATLFISFFLTTLWAGYSFAEPKDPCREAGIIVKNLTTRDLWYKSKTGPCSLWVKNHIFAIKPGDNIGIFSDMTCETNYCSDNPAYKGYKTIDSNGDCRVRILPGCKLSDM